MADLHPLSERISDLVRFDPSRDFDELLAPRRWRALMRSLPAEPEMRMEVKEDDSSYRVKAEIPGVAKDDIRVEIDGNRVAISAEVRRENEEKKGENTVWSERYYGRQSRTFTLAHAVDEGKAEAQYKDGVLELTLPKKAGEKAKQLTVK